MKKVIIICIILCSCFSIQAQLLWKVSGNGLEKPSYLFGTHHLAPVRIMEEVVELRPTLNSVDQVIGELDMSEVQNPEVMMKMQQMIVMTGDTLLTTLFTPEQYKLINDCAQQYLMMNLDAFQVLKPRFIENNLIVAMYIKLIGEDYNPEFQLDGFIQKLATNNEKKVIGLETPEFQFDLLFNGTSISRQATLLLCLIEDVEKQMQKAKELTHAYMAQDLDKMWAMAQEYDNTVCDPLPGEREALVDQRNIAWAEKLPELMKEGSSLVAVGALHLPGENGIINLLKKQGYKLEALK